MTWKKRAACADKLAWFDIPADVGDARNVALQERIDVCDTCDVFDECAALAERAKPVAGVWHGKVWANSSRHSAPIATIPRGWCQTHKERFRIVPHGAVRCASCNKKKPDPTEIRHGTVNGYNWHARHGVMPACVPCLEAKRAYGRESKRRRRDAERKDVAVAGEASDAA